MVLPPRGELDMIIRRALPGDERCLAELNVFVQALHVQHRPDFFKTSELDDVAAWFASLLSRPHVRVWLAEVDGVGVGYALVLLQERAENAFCLARRWHEIDQVSVAPSSRKQGICRGLIQKALAEAALDAVTDVEVSSWAFNAEAHEAFRRCGFRPRMLRFEASEQALGAARAPGA
jgi:GNAT superfamily N-acetyltransferase